MLQNESKIEIYGFAVAFASVFVPQCVAVLQRVAVRGRALQCVANKSQFGIYGFAVTFASVVELQCVTVCCSVLQCVAVYCSALQCVTVC